MFKMKKLLLVSTAILLALPATARDLNDTLILAYKYNPRLAAKQQELMARDELVPQALSGFMPQIAASADYGRERNEVTVRGQKDKLYDTENTRQLNLVQPLFNGGETIARTKRAYNAVSAAREELRSTEQDVLNNALVIHTDIVRTYQILELSKNNELVLKEQMESTKERFALGETTKTDVAQSEARYARAISDAEKARGDLNVAMSNYMQAVGETNRAAMPGPETFVMPANTIGIPNTLDDALKIAFDSNPELARQTFQAKVAENDVSTAYSTLLPDLSLRGNITKRQKQDIFPGNPTSNESVTLNLSVPLYQSGAEYSRVREAKQNREARKLEVYDITNAVRDDVIKSWEDLQTAKATIRSNEQNVQAATLALQGVKQEADVGTRTVLDVLDAEQELFVAKVNLITSRRNEIVSLYNLQLHMGRLSATDLALNVETFDPEKNFRRVRYKPIGF